MWQLPRWANVFIAGVLLVLAAGLVTVVAIPMVRQHRLDALRDSTRIELPATFNGQARTPVEAAQVALGAAGAGFTGAQVGLYGQEYLNLTMILAAKPLKAMSDRDQAAAREEFKRNFAKSSAGASFTLAQVADPGPLGGWFGCGPVQGVTICVATDPGSMVAVLMGPGTADPQELALSARSASVSRT